MSSGAKQFIAELYESNRDKMFRYAYRLIGRIERAEELVQEVFVLALLHEQELIAVSYTHLDVYKRQDQAISIPPCRQNIRKSEALFAFAYNSHWFGKKNIAQHEPYRPH